MSSSTEIHRFLEEKDGCIRKYPIMSSDRSRHLLDSFLAVDISLTDEQYNELLHMLAKAKFLEFRVNDDFHGFCVSDEFRPILTGVRCKRELSDPGNRIPNENRNLADMNQAQGEIDNNAAAAADNNGHAENGHEDEGSPMDTVTGGDDGDDDDNGDGDYDPVTDESRRLIIFRYEPKGRDLNMEWVQAIVTYVRAEDYQSWDDLAQAILTMWRQMGAGRMNYVVNNVTPANCWPRAETIFGCRANGLFQSLNWRSFGNFVDVRNHINRLLVFENLNGFVENGVANAEDSVPHANSDSEDDDFMIGEGQIMTYLYEFDHENMVLNWTDEFTVSSGIGGFESWADVAREYYTAYQLIHGLAPVEIEAQGVNPASCWPGADTIFGCWEHGRFLSLNWPSYDWEQVRQRLNCALLIVYDAENDIGVEG